MSTRALTIGTYGIISGAAITIATDGLIQPFAPVQTVRVYEDVGADGGPYRIDPYDFIRYDDQEVLTLIKMILDSGALDD